MYIVYADNQVIYHPELVDHGFAIYNPIVTQEANKSGSFQFTMPKTNERYNDLHKMKTIITVVQDGEEIFRGRILNDEKDFYNNKVIYCEGELAFLLDSIVRPVKEKMTVAGLFSMLVANHNNQVESEKQFVLGDVDVLPSTEIDVDIPDYVSTWYVLNSYLLDVYGGYVTISVSNGLRYLNYLSTNGTLNTQTVSFGVNLLDLSQYISAENVFTHLIPLGATYAQDIEPWELTPEERQQYPRGKEVTKIYTELIDNKEGSSEPKFIFSLRVGIDKQYIQNEQNISHIFVDYTVKTKTSSCSWSGLQGSKIYANLKLQDIRNTARYVDQKERIIATVQKPSGSITTTEQTLLQWSGDVNTGSHVITAEFINNYTKSDVRTKKLPISNSMAAVAQLQSQNYYKTTIATAPAESYHLANTDYIFDSGAEEVFGKIVAVHSWDDVDDPEELMRLGKEYLDDNIAMAVKLNVTAVDLSMIDPNGYEKFKIGDRIRVYSPAHPGPTSDDPFLNNLFVCNKVTLDLQHPENNTYSLGAEFKTLTESQVTSAKDIQVTQAMIESLNNSIDAAQTVVEQMNRIINTIYDRYADTKTIINNLDAAYAEIDFANITNAAIDNLIANTAILTKLDAAYAEIDEARITELNVDEVVAGLIHVATTLTAQELISTYASITELHTNYLTATEIEAVYATIDELHTDYIDADTIEADYMDINFANINQAAVENLTADSVFSNFLETNYADINFAHINAAAISKILGATGVFQNLVVNQDLTVAGRLNVALLAAGTILAEKLMLRGTDGLYYQLNITKKNELKDEAATPEEAAAIEAEWTRLDQDELKKTLHGENIFANTITAKQIAAGSITAQELAVLDASQVTFQYTPSGGSSTTENMGTFITDVNGLNSSVTTIQTTTLPGIQNTLDGSVASYTYRYYKHTSATSQPTDAQFDGQSGSDTMPAREDGKYIWRRTTQTKNDGTSSKIYEMIQGLDGEDGSQIWTTTTQPTTPNYTFTISNLTGNTGEPIKVGDLIFYSYYRYTVTSVGSTTVLAGTRQNLRGATGTGSYTFWGYAPTNDTSLNDMTDTPQANTKYIGVVSQSSSTRPTAKSSYTWSAYVGSDGIGIEKVEQLWYLKDTSNESTPTPPAAPTQLPVTTTTNAPNIWTLTTPSYVENHTYYTCVQTTYDDTPATITVSDPALSNQLTEVNRQVMQNSSLISQKADSVDISAWQTTTSEQFTTMGGRITELENTYESSYASLSVLPSQVDTLAQNVVYTETYDEDKDAFTRQIEKLQTGLFSVESDAITAVVGKVTALSDAQADLSQAFQVRQDGTYIYEATLKNKEVTILYYRSTSLDAPNKPTALVTTTSTAAGAWTKAIPVAGEYYYWACRQTNYNVAGGDATLSSKWDDPYLLKERPSETSTKTVPYASIIPTGYLKSSSRGIEIHVNGSLSGWHTTEGIGGRSLSLGDAMDTQERWQFVMNGDLLNISWHT